MRRIAIFTPGGIAPEKTRQFIPAHVNLVRRLSEWFEITVYSLSYPGGNLGPFRCGNAQVTYVAASHSGNNLLKINAYLKAFFKDHRERPFDLIHGLWAYPCGSLALIFGKIAGIPSLVSVLGAESASLPEIHYGNMRKEPLRTITLQTCEHATRLVALTAFQVALLKSHGLKRSAEEIIPFGAESAFYAAPDGRSLPEPPFHFLHVGHLNKVKDQITLLMAFKLISKEIDCRLRIAGEDFLNGELEKAAGELGLLDRVEFLGYIPQDELPMHYRWAHCMLHTSLYEAQGVVLSDAAASGLLVCGTRVGLLADQHNDWAVAVEPGDYQALARETLSLLRNRERMNRLREKSSQWACSRSAEWTALQYRRVYETLIAQ